ncbi:uncharacterized protein LOC112101070 [Citrus clementina]|uniref:uncharacterized protein LOC112101070 n=1 Tax=Citrus clementina TaxID=85681 RepID=UPI000CED060F|nr:uncharacterized protein LOC112101070 [Citrus x clementina]
MINKGNDIAMNAAKNAICTGSNPEINALFAFCQKRTVCKVFLLSIIDGYLQPKFSPQISRYRSRSPATILLKLPTNQPSCVPSVAVTATDNHYVTTTTTHKAAATSAPEATPPKGCFKDNVDAAINVSNQKAGLGVVIGNSMGKVVAAAVQGALYRGEVTCMEAEAVLFDIQSAHQADCFPMIIESDSKEVVDLSLNKKTSKAEKYRGKLQRFKLNWTIRTCPQLHMSLGAVILLLILLQR